MADKPGNRWTILSQRQVQVKGKECRAGTVGALPKCRVFWLDSRVFYSSALASRP